MTLIDLIWWHSWIQCGICPNGKAASKPHVDLKTALTKFDSVEFLDAIETTTNGTTCGHLEKYITIISPFGCPDTQDLGLSMFSSFCGCESTSKVSQPIFTLYNNMKQ